ncbi:MAG: penicillin-binding protein 2, partial [Gammaproteobacteria bacterium]|nr:penicillin-binding protein 2 [Gammaproteobacteria bacterium]
MKKKQQHIVYSHRHKVVLGGLVLVAGLLLFRALDLHIFSKDFLQDEGAARHLRTVILSAHRGVISDRHGEPLAISTPVDSVWVNPLEFSTAQKRWGDIAAALDMPKVSLQKMVATRKEREFVYLRRRVTPDIADKVRALDVPGVYLLREYRRYYPAGEVAGHILGFTNIDDKGQE